MDDQTHQHDGGTMTAVRVRPIIFSAPMIRAILDGRKTQTRRVVKPQPESLGNWWTSDGTGNTYGPGSIKPSLCDDGLWFSIPGLSQSVWGWKYGKPGDRLWVRETWCPRSGGMLAMDAICRPRYRADGELRPEWGFKWRSPIHMPRRASRITLEVTDVRVERVQEASVIDLVAEGVAVKGDGAFWAADPATGERLNKEYRSWWQERWERLHGADGWATNPWVWVISFKRV